MPTRAYNFGTLSLAVRHGMQNTSAVMANHEAAGGYSEKAESVAALRQDGSFPAKRSAATVRFDARRGGFSTTYPQPGGQLDFADSPAKLAHPSRGQQ